MSKISAQNLQAPCNLRVKVVSSHQPSRQAYCRSTHRLHEIEAVIHSRWGTLPDTDDADIVLFVVARTIVRMAEWRRLKLDVAELTIRLVRWCDEHAPDVSPIHIRHAAKQALRWRRGVDTADAVARTLKVTWQERCDLGLTTIGACDISRQHRARLAKDRKRQRDRERAYRKRHTLTRITHETPKARMPWDEAGVSRATWYRHRAKQARADARENGSETPKCREQSPESIIARDVSPPDAQACRPAEAAPLRRPGDDGDGTISGARHPAGPAGTAGREGTASKPAPSLAEPLSSRALFTSKPPRPRREQRAATVSKLLATRFVGAVYPEPDVWIDYEDYGTVRRCA